MLLKSAWAGRHAPAERRTDATRTKFCARRADALARMALFVRNQWQPIPSEQMAEAQRGNASLRHGLRSGVWLVRGDVQP